MFVFGWRLRPPTIIRRDWCGGPQYTLLHSHRLLVLGGSGVDAPGGGGGTPYVMGDTYGRGFDPFFHFGRIEHDLFGVFFSHPPTRKRSFGYKSSQNSIFLAPKYHFSLDLFGSNFQWPAAHPQQFSDRVPPRGLMVRIETLLSIVCHRISIIILVEYRLGLLGIERYHGFKRLLNLTDTSFAPL